MVSFERRMQVPHGPAGQSKVSKSLLLSLLLPPVFVLEPPISRKGDEGGPSMPCIQTSPEGRKGSALSPGARVCPLQVRM